MAKVINLFWNTFVAYFNMKSEGLKMAEQAREATNKLSKPEREKLRMSALSKIKDADGCSVYGTIKALDILLKADKKYNSDAEE